jgi:molecular chaperone GrpE
MSDDSDVRAGEEREEPGAADASAELEVDIEAGAEVEELEASELETALRERDQWWSARMASLEAELHAQTKRLDEVHRAYRNFTEDTRRANERREREAERELEDKRTAMIKAFFEVADNLDRSAEAARSSRSFDALMDGIELVRAQFLRALEGLGVEPLNAQGEPFDPTLHEAVATLPVQDPALHQTVVAVFRQGFRAGNAVLRPAMVQVGQYNG